MWMHGILVATPKTKVHIDPAKKFTSADLISISHAHSDHTGGFLSETLKLTTPETLEIFTARSGKSISKVKTINYLQSCKCGDFKIKLHNAGHVLGSAQIELETSSNKIIYTSDFNLKDSLTLNGAEILEGEVLIIDSTYGTPPYVFPPREEVYFEMVEWAAKQILKRKIPVFQVYPVGKAQEVIKIFNEYSRFDVVVDKKIENINQVYINSGISLECLYDDTKEGMRMINSGDCIYVTSTSNRKFSESFMRSVSLAKVTGWGLTFKNTNATYFPLSAHADFMQLTKYVEESGAEKVYTVFGQAKLFAKYLRKKLHVSATPISEMRQKEISEFI
ncbi:MAG: hypothetical protein ACTSSJ_05295 [Candidatus Odinarchaeia archaeon]